MPDDYDFPDEDTLKKENYKEFKLTDVQEKNLKEIERDLKNNIINSENKGALLEYLEDLYSDVLRIKESERSYEGEQNFNVNRYLERIKNLIKQLERI